MTEPADDFMERMRISNEDAIAHVHAIMFGLDKAHIAQPYLLIIEAFLQREILGAELQKLQELKND